MVAIFTTSINNDMNNTLFRASQLGKLMTDARTKSGLSETTKSALLEVYIQQRYNRYKEISNKYIEKGLAVENDAIDMIFIVLFCDSLHMLASMVIVSP